MTPSEQALAFLNRVRQDHRKDLEHVNAHSNAPEQPDDPSAPFPYGQDFYVEEEVWDTEEDDYLDLEPFLRLM